MSAGVIIFWGILSAYSLRPTVGTINYRQDLGQLPQDVSMYDAVIAVNHCGLLGHEATIMAGDEIFTAIVFDCTGNDGVDYFSRGDDLSTPFKIAGEVGFHFWEERPDIVHSLVKIRVEK